MRIGRTQSFICDNPDCQKHFTEGEILTTLKTEYHWCSENCRIQYAYEEFNDHIQDRIQEEVAKELKYLHGLVCPACKYRLARSQ